MKWRIGEVTVTKIVELEVAGGSRFILPQATYEAVLPIGWLQPDFADERGRLKMSIHALVVETPRRRIIVNTCLGNDKENRRIPTWNKLQTSFLTDLAAAGYARQAIDTVVCTHLHVDHVGWNTMLVDGRWVPTFPNARYLMGRLEYAHWTSQREREDMTAVLPTRWHRSGMPDLSISSRPTTGYVTRSASSQLRAIPRPRQRTDHLGRRGSADHRRLYAPPLSDRPAGVVLDRRFRSGPRAADAGANVNRPRRHADAGHRHSFRGAYGGPCRARRRRIPSGG